MTFTHRLDVSAHLERLLQLFKNQQNSHAEFLYVDDLANVRWLTGFAGSNGFAIIDVAGELIHLFTDSRYREQSRTQADAAGAQVVVHVPSSVSEQDNTLTQIVGTAVMGVHPHSLSVARYGHIKDLCSVIEVEELFSEARRQKSAGEIERIARAAHIADQSLQHVLSGDVVGKTERTIKAELEYHMVLRGADGPSFATIVAAGENAAIPHHRPSDRVLKEGDVVVVDMGALVEGYHSDMTRTVCVGAPAEEIVHLYEITAQAQRAALDTVCAGVLTSDVDEAARKVFRDARLLDLFQHGLGHGVGLDIHEEPYLSRRPGQILQDGEVVTVEPGLYRVGVGGVRIEDLVVVTQDGHHCLTHTPKDLVCLRSAPTI